MDNLEKIKDLYNLLSDREKAHFNNFLNRSKQEEEKNRQEAKEEILETLKSLKAKDGTPFFSEEYLEQHFK